MKRNSLKIILIMLLSIFCITGCGKATLKENEMIETLPNELKLAFVDDIPYTLDVKEFEITKKKTSEDYDVVYCTVLAKNDTYQVTRNVVLYYTFYDKGGWILDDYQIESARTEAISGFPQKFADLEMDNYYFDTYTYKGAEFDETNQITKTTYDVSFAGSNISYDGEVTLVSKFINDGYSGFWETEIEYSENGLKVLIDGLWAFGSDDSDGLGDGYGAFAAEIEFRDVNMDKLEANVNATGYYQSGLKRKEKKVEVIEQKSVLLTWEPQGYEAPKVKMNFSSGSFEYNLTVSAEKIKIKLKSPEGWRQGELYNGYTIRVVENDFGYDEYIKW